MVRISIHTVLFACVLSFCARAMAGSVPLVFACESGVQFICTDHAAVIETPNIRTPGTVACPFMIAGSCAETDTAESISYINEQGPYCSWRIDAYANSTEKINIIVPSTVGIDNIEFWQASNHFVIDRSASPYLNPCDLNMDGTVNVYDFMGFLNSPYDYNQNGEIDVTDWYAISDTCGSD